MRHSAHDAPAPSIPGPAWAATSSGTLMPAPVICAITATDGRSQRKKSHGATEADPTSYGPAPFPFLTPGSKRRAGGAPSKSIRSRSPAGGLACLDPVARACLATR